MDILPSYITQVDSHGVLSKDSRQTSAGLPPVTVLNVNPPSEAER